jgi:ligand-binding sensor domain-containing protein
MILRILLCMLLVAELQAQPYNFLSYSVAEGLAQSQVYALCQDSRGYLWCGTQGGGLSRFDGLDFQTFSSANGLPSDFINAIFEDSQKRIWVGTNAGYAVIEQSQYCAGFKQTYAVNAICETAEGEIWLGTNKGILACKSPTDSPLPVENLGEIASTSYTVHTFFPTKNGIWVGTNRGAYRVATTTPIALTTKNGLRSNLVTAFARDVENRLWIATPGNGIVILDEDWLKVVGTHLQALYPNCLRLDPTGKMWVGTSNEGLFIFDSNGQSWSQVNENQGLPHNHIREILLDRNDQMWVATSGGGMARVLSQQFRHYSSANGLVGNRIYALHADAKGQIWLAASQNGIQMLDSTGFHEVMQDSGILAGVKCKAITTDRRGRIWVGTEGRGLFVLDSFGARPILGFSSPRIQSVLMAPTGNIWVATMDHGIALLREDPARPGNYSVKKFGQNEGLKDLNITTLRADGKGNAWFGTQSGGFGFFEAEKLKASFGGVKNGLPELPIRAMVFDLSGRLWLGFRGGGVWGGRSADLESGKTARFLPLPAQLASQNIYLLQPDLAGHLWVGTEKGVDEVIFELDQTNTVKEVRHYGRSEGFLGIETCQDAAICDRVGNLWFGTMNGLTQYIPTIHHVNRSAPILHFKEITLFYKPLAETRYADWLDPEGGLYPGIRFDWNENHLSFEFRAIDLANPEGLRYRWKLEGSPNAEWSPFSEQQSVNFAGLQAGDYTFWAQAVSADGTLSDPIRASFSTKKPFWQTLWFWMVVGVLLIGFAYFLVKNRIRQVRKIELEKREKLEVENRLLQLEQKALQLQMNPHFIFNALNSVQALVSTGDTVAARTELNAFAQLMRSILSNSRQQVVTLREEADTLVQYLQIEQFCRPGKPFDFSLKFSEAIDPEAIELPPMLLQPFVENAVLHGLAHLQERRGNIEISFEIQDETLRCTIADNGVGREKAALLRGERQPGHSSAALQITQERLEALAEHRIDKPLEFNDIHDLSGEIVGTKVIVQIPLRLRW